MFISTQNPFRLLLTDYQCLQESLLMNAAKFLFASILILQTNLIFGIEISGFVIRNFPGPSPASVYANGTRIAIASDDGYFQGEVTESNIKIYAELNLANGIERSIPRQINVSTDTTVQLNIAPLRRITINSELPAGTYGPWLRIYEAVTPSESLFNTNCKSSDDLGPLASKTKGDICSIASA